jgi:hypothetical protein
VQDLDTELWARIASFVEAEDDRWGAAPLYYALLSCKKGQIILSHFGVPLLRAGGGIIEISGDDVRL